MPALLSAKFDNKLFRFCKISAFILYFFCMASVFLLYIKIFLSAHFLQSFCIFSVQFPENFCTAYNSKPQEYQGLDKRYIPWIGQQHFPAPVYWSCNLLRSKQLDIYTSIYHFDRYPAEGCFGEKEIQNIQWITRHRAEDHWRQNNHNLQLKSTQSSKVWDIRVEIHFFACSGTDAVMRP